MDIDANAPLKAQKEIWIDAPVDQVWAALTEIERWPTWQPNVSKAEPDGPLEVGQTFRWKAMGLGIRSTIGEFVEQERIGWSGISLGMSARHRWQLETAKAGTHVLTQESLDGWMAKLLKTFDRRFLEKSLDAALADLKRESERVSGTLI